MPRLVKGGKWVYGWVVISAERKMPIPPEAWPEYGFRAGDQVLFLRGSRRSGGFGITTPERIADACGQLESDALIRGTRVLGQARLDRDGSVTLPPAIEAGPGDRLLAVRGSRLALGFVAQGPIYEEAARHPELAQLPRDPSPHIAPAPVPGGDEISVSYPGMAAWVHRITEPAIRSAIRALELPPGSRGLDAGCGVGTHTLWLAEAISPGGTVTGVDISPGCLARAQETASRSGLAERVAFQYADMNDLAFEDDAFDWAWNADTLWPVAGKDPLPLVHELVRVVKPGGTVAILFWSSQRLLPGYPLLEARLNATRAANFPYTSDTNPELHILRALGWLQRAGLEELKARTFVADVQAPLGDAARNALTGSFQMFWGKAEPEVASEDWAAFQRLCRPGSQDFVLNLPGYYAFITYTLFCGQVPRQAAPS